MAGRLVASPALAFLLAIQTACTSTIHVRYQVPIDTPDGHACVARCESGRAKWRSEHGRNAENAFYAECLNQCPDSRATTEAHCPHQRDPRTACAEQDRDNWDPVGAVVVTLFVVATVFVAIVSTSSGGSDDSR